MEQETVDPNFKQGFEAGYWLRRGDRPELQDIIDNAVDPELKAGLEAGGQEAEREVFLTSLKERQATTQENKLKGPRPR